MTGALRAFAPYIAALLVGALFSWWVASNHWQARYSQQQTIHATQLRLTAEANAQVILQQQTEQQEQAQRLVELDTKHTQELSDALKENRRLEALYSNADDERRRLRIDVIVARNDAIVSETVGAGSVGDADSLELSGAAGRAVWDIRRGMIEDREKLEYLQRYISLQEGRNTLLEDRAQHGLPETSDIWRRQNATLK
ncbi:prophage endopeptidase [Halopseudomonas litoralis]|uniref:Prophage endopeptidase n=1 Tax=Halopseudomonas litoralis TaxID=797277 RepID=A0A1H1NZQ7_9GAMM|nr:lysis system i-spanin subunit Rz [Halopseudomonas litoralis]SDS04260.1 prophage endopeptidase [Halopseudomonas litoralis]